MNMNKIVLITGASSGVGLSLTHYLSKRFRVIAIARRIEKIKEEFENNPNVEPFKIDLSDKREVVEGLEELIQKWGFIPYLINNAGINEKSSIQDLTDEQIWRSLQVNAIAPITILKKLLPGMKYNDFGRVINITSGAPLNCFPEFGAYSASKGALNALTVTASKECSGFNIKINLMSPGPVRTEMAPNAPMDPSVCHPTVDFLLRISEDGPTGRFFWLGYEIPLFPNLDGIHWLEGNADERYKKVI